MSFACPNCGGRRLVLYVNRPVVLIVLAESPSDEGYDRGYDVHEEINGDIDINEDDTVECQTCNYSSDVRAAQHASLNPHDWREEQAQWEAEAKEAQLVLLPDVPQPDPDHDRA